MMFQQRHFEAIAQIMQELKPRVMPNEPGAAEFDRLRQWTLTVNALSKLFASTNDRFSLGRFERACEPGANVRARKAA